MYNINISCNKSTWTRYSPHIGGLGEDDTRTALSPNTTAHTLTQDHRIATFRTPFARRMTPKYAAANPASATVRTTAPHLRKSRPIGSCAERDAPISMARYSMCSDILVSLLTHSSRSSSANVALRLILWSVKSQPSVA